MSNAETSQKARCGQQGRQRGCAGAPEETSLSESLSLPARGLSIEPAPSVRRANDRATQHLFLTLGCEREGKLGWLTMRQTPRKELAGTPG